MAKKPRSVNGARSQRSRGKPKTDPAAPGGAAVGDNSAKRNSDEMGEAFRSHRSSWNGWKAKRAVVDALERDVKAALKSEGFTVKQFEIADQLGTLKGEAKVTGEVRDRLKVALWIGHPMGAQLDLFEQPDRTPVVDRAYAEGKAASMNDVAAKPPHAPDTEAYRAYMAGFHDHQRELAGGIKAPRSFEESKAHGETAAQS